MLRAQYDSVARTALFQPWIQFPGIDWLKCSLLLRDRIERIIPDSPNVPDLAPTNELEVLASHGLIGDQLVSIRDAEATQNVVLETIESAQDTGLFDRWQTAGQPFLRNPEYTRIHIAKVGHRFACQLAQLGVRSHRDGDFLYSEPAVIALYMLNLAQLLHSRDVSTCIVSDSQGYAGLDTLIGESAEPEGNESSFYSLLIGLNINPASLIAMSAEDYAAWHRENSSLRDALRKKLSQIGSDPIFLPNRLQAARDDFNHYVDSLPRRHHFPSDPMAIAGIALPLVGTALDLVAGTYGLGELITVPVGAMLAGAAVIKQRRSSGWERYLVEIAKVPPADNAGVTDALGSLLRQLHSPNTRPMPGSDDVELEARPGHWPT